MSLKALTASLSTSDANGLILTPLLTDFLFERDRQLEKGTLSKKQVVIADAKRTIRTFERRMNEFNHGEKERIPGAFHPSSIGRCKRQKWLEHFGAPQQRESKMDSLRKHLTFELGTYFHVFIQNLCAAAGILVKREVEVLSEVPPVEGHCDGILKIDKVLYALEIKTINPYEFTKLTGPKFEHRQQVTMYMHFLGVKRAIVLYFDKGSSQFKEYVILYDANFYNEHVLGEMKSYLKAIRLRDLPARISEDPHKFPCSYCRHLELCYDPTRLKKFVRKVKDEGIT